MLMKELAKKSGELDMQRLKLAIATALVAVGTTGGAIAAECGTDREIEIAEMSWPSAAVFANIHATILEEGFGCEVELTAGETVPVLATMISKGVPAIAPELWPNASKEAWEKGLSEGKIYNLGLALSEGLEQGWYIPQYVADANPGLKHVDDLADHVELFKDPDDPSKGRFYSCPPGWACEIMNPNFIKAYGLDESFNLFSPGSGGALDASIARAFTREEPIVFYYWGPTAMMGRFDMVRLEMDAFDEEKFACMGDPNCENPERTDFIVPDAVKAVVPWVEDELPEVKAYLEKVSLTNAQAGALMVYADENKASAQDTAMHFLKTQEDIWTKWVDEDVAAAVKASLN